ncbi:MAG TPA: NUDIX domain-containing protein [Terriglobales bacterium]|nr:NUDIX domain-containing protein [Terriglobales bacterium]
MVREFSAGGVVLRRMQGQWWIAAIEPAGRRKPGNTGDKPDVLALPKGLVDAGEKPDQTALREVREETGVEAALLTKLKDIKYFYVRSWGDRERVFKVVSFFLLKYQAGRLGDITPEMRHEVQQALWLPLSEAASRLSYRGEREVARTAEKYVEEHPEL